MNSIFLRIYGGILLVLVGVSLLALLGVQMVNGLRIEQYREQIAHGTFRLMADNLAPLERAQRSKMLALWTRLVGVPLELRYLPTLGLESSVASRLQRGQVLVRPAGQDAVNVFVMADNSAELVLTANIQQISEQLGRATLFLIADELVRHPESQMPTQLAALARDKAFGYPLRLFDMAEVDLDVEQRRRLEESDTVLTLGPDSQSLLLFMKIPDTRWVLGLGPLHQMSEYPPSLLLPTVLLALTLIGLLIYLLVRQLEQRLRGLERVAVDIARGNLDARADVAGADSVGQLATSFNDMASHLQGLMAIQREMISAVSHELRTPIARLRFGLEMLECADSSSDRQRFARGMDSDLSDLDGLVDEILTYARLEQGAPAMRMQAVNLRKLAETLADEMQPLRADLQLLIQIPDIWVDAEPRYLQRAIANLVGNAMRHASARLAVSAELLDGQCRLRIEDDGPGIPEQQRARIFTPFLRLDDSRTRASGGYGLGLAIVRRIAFWHRGQVWVEESATLGGACFVLALPQRQQ